MNNKELNNEELGKVTGGSSEENAPSTCVCGNWTFTGFIKKYAEGHIGENVYLVSHDKDHYYYGQLRDSYEYEKTFWTIRTQVILCQEYNGSSYSGIVEISGDDYWIYRERIK